MKINFKAQLEFEHINYLFENNCLTYTNFTKLQSAIYVLHCRYVTHILLEALSPKIRPNSSALLLTTFNLSVTKINNRGKRVPLVSALSCKQFLSRSFC